eukprot:CAMPEP_0201547990 /NCGR_PEP_ID=MMETSP0173_2-20130828/4497_1 /ASSEMBLY_ACC=CAM_ASM_000268 /TAXON_ID=218659 /ORGANISM="Vexillifera sp., Strain DIVA3 564/2" /LENGTH=405 /DNA_ID=CAMNT_0047957211 /DNA_START=181 /DNA_END=1398 /DNA_ORIENTATION=+
MTPLELWLSQLRDWGPIEAKYVYTSCKHMALELVKSGCTAVLDHLTCIPGVELEMVEAAVRAYREVGIRAYICPLIGDLDYDVCIPCSCDAEHRERRYTPIQEASKILAWLEQAVKQFHRPDEGIEIGVGPTGIQLCSDELIVGCRKLSEKYNLVRHIHVLETQAQRKLSQQKYGCSAVVHLDRLGFLSEKTSCAHSIHLDDNDIAILKKTGATAVHNALSNLRLGSGIAPLLKYIDQGVNVSYGCDGSASNDSQDMLEAIKIGTILHNITEKDYKRWITPRKAIEMATQGGAKGVGAHNTFGSIKEGFDADLVLYDLSDFSMLPRTDPIGMIVLGRVTNAVDTVFIRGKIVIENKQLLTLDEQKLKAEIVELRKAWCFAPQNKPSETLARMEPKYRVAMGLSKL